MASHFSKSAKDRKPPEIRLRNETGVPEEVARTLRVEEVLTRMIAGEGSVDEGAVKAVAARVRVAMADYLESGKGLGWILKPVEIVSAIDAALKEAAGIPSPLPEGDNARVFFLHGLYEEIVQQPSNLFETRVFPDGSERYVPMGKAVWRACLEKVKAEILKAEK